jgi:crotonobetaine/carnitine-CoA ligase
LKLVRGPSAEAGPTCDPAPPASLAALVGAGTATVGEVLRARAAASADRDFLSFAGRRWTWAEALAESADWAARFRLHAASRPLRVATWLHNRPEALWCWFGAHLAGDVLIALNRQHRGRLLAEMVERTRPDVIVTDAGLDERAPLIAGAPGAALLDAEAADPLAAEPPAARPVAAHDLATLMFSSGSTGRSKAVMIPHGMLTRGAARVADALALGQDDVFHAWLPLYHIFGQLHVAMATAIAGGRLALLPRFSASGFLAECRSEGATVFGGLSTALRHLLAQPPSAGDRDHRLRVGVAGELTPQLQAQFERRYGAPLVDSYGMTEAEPLTLPRPGQPTPPGSCGVAAPDFELAVFRPDGARAARGEVGVVRVRPRAAAVMFRGYEGEPARTLQAMPDLWFDTGDLARMDAAGFLYLHGRASEVVRRKGENISLAEVEALLAALPGIAEAVCAPVSAHGEVELKFAVRLAGGAAATPAGLAQRFAAEFAPFIRPRYIEVVDAIPRTDLGKPLRAELAGLSGRVWDVAANQYCASEEREDGQPVATP